MKTNWIGSVTGCLSVALLFVGMSASADHSCQRYAETVALNRMLANLIEEVAPETLSEEQRPGLTGTMFLDENNEESQTETGIYAVEMSVMEECLDGLLVKTRVVTDANGNERCSLVEVSGWPFGDRECG